MILILSSPLASFADCIVGIKYQYGTQKIGQTEVVNGFDGAIESVSTEQFELDFQAAVGSKHYKVVQGSENPAFSAILSYSGMLTRRGTQLTTAEISFSGPGLILDTKKEASLMRIALQGRNGVAKAMTKRAILEIANDLPECSQ